MNKFRFPLVVVFTLLGWAIANHPTKACASPSTCCLSPSNLEPAVKTVADEDRSIEPIHQLIRFLSYLSHSNDGDAYGLIAPSSIKNGDPIAYQSPLDRHSFDTELRVNPNRVKYAEYHLGELRWESPNRLRLFVHFENGDNDEVLLVRENAQWRVADPIHIIR